MKIIRKIPVKQVLTEDSKKIINDNFKHRIQQLEQECQQLLFEEKKLSNTKGISKEEVYRRFQQEITKRKEKIKWTEYQIEQLNSLPLGSKITEDEVEALVEVTEGVSWQDVMGEKAIVVKDGKVIEVK
ncbi:YlqD family protein [Radiobacillus sp. PE A8.2]|uniref:YlqD family protein n=1 Tax=Radiobacillus sp. PE A8.2 TaxID=3380349 RepID=UPI00388D4A8F